MNEFQKISPENEIDATESRFAKIYHYLSEKNATLKNDYKTPDGQYLEACSLLATDIARLLLDIGEKPELMSVHGPEKIENGWEGKGLVIPKIYQGRIKWGGHTICVCNNVVYDPMLGEPKNLSEYQKETFMEPVEMNVLISADTMKEFLNR